MSTSAIRVVVRGAVQNVGFRDATLTRARGLGVMGWVRNEEGPGTLLVHAEGSEGALEELAAFLGEGPRPARVDAVEIEEAAVEGHEQFAIRGVSAGAFVVTEHAVAGGRGFDLSLEVDGAMRSWRIPKGPSLDPAVKRFAVERDQGAAGEKGASKGIAGEAQAIVWDSGTYEQGGRVAWPEALERGHGVFVLHGEKLHGGFALQRTRSAPKAQWLLIKRRDDHARPGSEEQARA